MGESRACCIGMEYLQRGFLNKFLHEKRKEKLPFKIVIQLALDLARGLSYLHSKKIIHRDVKTGTMLLDSNGNLKIAHFGFACVEAENPKDSFLEYCSSTGTLGYVAPEVRIPLKKLIGILYSTGNPIIENATSTASGYVYGKYIDVIGTVVFSLRWLER
ncbi:hypothetical protein BUALT_Bualt12G0133800 [Buddleja alternifolia]|uniref:Protein kinase domain-containing protein n=1 Tax=Buddleja alternifolia TaxID=168488 RepID=A0AAV6WSA8_9LAMI|nr:hypothetical protein BUALT_Bualt12G0133800 [Buddleja alternifolia]